MTNMRTASCFWGNFGIIVLCLVVVGTTNGLTKFEGNSPSLGDHSGDLPLKRRGDRIGERKYSAIFQDFPYLRK